MRGYEARSNIMTSNRPLEDWGKLVGDVPSATAILDRFLHHAEMITIAGRSYRLRNQAGTGEPQEEPEAPTEKATRKRQVSRTTEAMKSETVIAAVEDKNLS